MTLDSIDSLSAQLCSQIILAENSAPDYRSQRDQLTKNKDFCVSTLDYNCSLLHRLCLLLLDAVVINYQLEATKDREDVDKLRADFSEFCRDAIVHDSRKVGILNAKQVTAAIRESSKPIWESVQMQVQDELTKYLSKGELPTYAYITEVKAK